jgi:hypothetical protein
VTATDCVNWYTLTSYNSRELLTKLMMSSDLDSGLGTKGKVCTGLGEGREGIVHLVEVEDACLQVVMQ